MQPKLVAHLLRANDARAHTFDDANRAFHQLGVGGQHTFVEPASGFVQTNCIRSRGGESVRGSSSQQHAPIHFGSVPSPQLGSVCIGPVPQHRLRNVHMFAARASHRSIGHCGMRVHTLLPGLAIQCSSMGGEERETHAAAGGLENRTGCRRAVNHVAKLCRRAFRRRIWHIPVSRPHQRQQLRGAPKDYMCLSRPAGLSEYALST